MCHCGSSLVEAFNATQGLSHTRLSNPTLTCHPDSITKCHLHNHSGVTASCSVGLQDTIWIMFALKIISKLCSAKNNVCRSEEASELGHIGLLYCLSSQKYISKTLNVTHYFHWQVATET